MEAGTIQPLMEALVQVKPTPVAIAEITVYSLSFRKTPRMAAAQVQVVSGGPVSYAPPGNGYSGNGTYGYNANARHAGDNH